MHIRAIGLSYSRKFIHILAIGVCSTLWAQNAILRYHTREYFIISEPSGKTDPSFSVVERIANVLEVDLTELFNNNELKDINSYDKSIIEKINLLEQLEPSEKSAFYTMLDALITKKKLKDNLTNALQSI